MKRRLGAWGRRRCATETALAPIANTSGIRKSRNAGVPSIGLTTTAARVQLLLNGPAFASGCPDAERFGAHRRAPLRCRSLFYNVPAGWR